MVDVALDSVADDDVAGVKGGAPSPASSEAWIVGGTTSVGPVVVVGLSVYAGGGSLEGTVNAFMPGLSGRRVAGEGFVSGFGLGVRCLDVLLKGLRGLGEGVGEVGVLESELLERCEALDLLRPSLRIEPRNERDGTEVSEGLMPHAESGAMMVTV